jgi:hypothetical protein
VNIDDFMFKRFVKERYTCMEFSREVWLALTGEDMGERLVTVLRREFHVGEVLRAFKRFKRLQKPVSPCLVYMTQLGHDPHMGVYIDGSLLHLTMRGPEYLPLEIAARGFTHFRFYQ